MLRADDDKSLEIAVFGDTEAGKTSFVTRYCKNIFREETETTMGIALHLRDICRENFKCRLKIWDVTGLERFFHLGVTSAT